ncbi:hypothetical protein amrb99_97170 [Actinomadura sp. RB99]|nr:hypothetical protein [Actinomadura sp. RB99]
MPALGDVVPDGPQMLLVGASAQVVGQQGRLERGHLGGALGQRDRGADGGERPVLRTAAQQPGQRLRPGARPAAQQRGGRPHEEQAVDAVGERDAPAHRHLGPHPPVQGDQLVRGVLGERAGRGAADVRHQRVPPAQEPGGGAAVPRGAPGERGQGGGDAGARPPPVRSRLAGDAHPFLPARPDQVEDGQLPVQFLPVVQPVVDAAVEVPDHPREPVAVRAQPPRGHAHPPVQVGEGELVEGARLRVRQRAGHAGEALGDVVVAPVDARPPLLGGGGQRAGLHEVDGAVGRDGPLDVLRAAEQPLDARREAADLPGQLAGEHRRGAQGLRDGDGPRTVAAFLRRPDHAVLGHDLRLDAPGAGVDEEVVDVGLLLDDALADAVRRGDDVPVRPVAGVAGEGDERPGSRDHPLDADRDPRGCRVDAPELPVADGLGLERRRPAARHRLQQPVAPDVQEAVAQPGERIVRRVLAPPVRAGDGARAHRDRPARARRPAAGQLVETREQAGREGTVRDGRRQRLRGEPAPLRGRDRRARRQAAAQRVQRPVELRHGHAEELRHGKARVPQCLQPGELVPDLPRPHRSRPHRSRPHRSRGHRPAHHTFGSTRARPAAYGG